ncbi:M1 family metallopeptidase [Asticcacaulis sp. AC402]|uniref:M1 family metallopeptidase n=1 Tax=Asticcacaulis sp. AC402 TaxID=1282361 RepID=UPI0003C3BB77|nr:M1 family metallopeptidase [Asticcacaulis sp. AC402]ESQ77234.1 peptidase M1 [Asticcacaulis sp. AC402]
MKLKASGSILKRAGVVVATLCATVAFCLVIPLTACQPKTAGESGPEAIVKTTVDDHSYARPQVARVNHVDIDLTADFTKKLFKGTATLTLTTEANAKQVILDVKALTIEKVTDASGAPLKYTVGKDDAMMGSALTIELPQGAQKIIVHYQTTARSAALQWLDPSQTAGKSKPFLFSQGQEIRTRTWIPTQDSPAIRQTYSARIVVPADLTVVMAAKALTPEGEAVPGRPAQRAYRFEMDQPIAPYLIAVAIGDIGFKSLGPRTGVYAETSMLDKSAYELEEMEALMTAAEKLYGPYRWGRYDVLVLPPSFPYGGMENPMVTFATPTILAGDRSLVSLIAHELAHSWSGNLVTNATWSDFWLNEGFTVYFENRIMEQVYGKDRADMLKVLGYQDLQATLKATKPDFTRLHPNLKGIDPADYFSDIPYEKGAAFLRMLEGHFGRKKLDAYLKSYFERYAFESMTTDAFVVDLRTHLLKNDADLEKQLKIQQWLYEPGLPDNVVVPKSSLLDKVTADAEGFATSGDAAALNVADYGTLQWVNFLRKLPTTLTLEQMAALDARFDFSQSKNSEILFEWLQLSIKHRYEPALPMVEAFLLSQGRNKFCKPLYQSLMEQPGWGVEMAKRVYVKARPGYHEMTRTNVDKVVGTS